MENILICDDEKEIVDSIELYLEDEGFKVIKAHDGFEAIEALKTCKIHLAVLDIMMPNMDGIRLIKEIRKKSSIPVIFLSAKSEDADKILGLNLGADDYITKPFNPLELVARIKSNLRRYMDLGSAVNTTGVYSSGGLCLDEEAKTCYVYGDEVRLTPIEHSILLFLVKNKGKVYSIEQIFENIWQDYTDGFRSENTVTVHIRHIREKIEINPKDPKFLKLVWGVGYKVEDI
ncbi:MAG: response regulator transcription factor [Butyrivibrio sp.]|nr:response regulator transcription factor [Butyrivibrio sp.]